MLSRVNCGVLTRLLDDKWLDNPLVDFKMVLSRLELSQYIGEDGTQSLSKLMQDDFDKIILRRCSPEGLCIKFHLDVTTKVMQVALNDDDEYTGGRLMFLTGDGTLHVPKRTAGSYTIHNSFVVHGVSEHKEGLRYGLFFIKERDSIVTVND